MVVLIGGGATGVGGGSQLSAMLPGEGILLTVVVAGGVTNLVVIVGLSVILGQQITPVAVSVGVVCC